MKHCKLIQELESDRFAPCGNHTQNRDALDIFIQSEDGGAMYLEKVEYDPRLNAIILIPYTGTK